MNSSDIWDVALGILVAIIGGLYTFFPQWFFKKWAPEQQAWQRKLFRIFGPAFLVLGFVLIAMQFM